MKLLKTILGLTLLFASCKTDFNVMPMEKGLKKGNLLGGNQYIKTEGDRSYYISKRGTDTQFAEISFPLFSLGNKFFLKANGVKKDFDEILLYADKGYLNLIMKDKYEAKLKFDGKKIRVWSYSVITQSIGNKSVKTTYYFAIKNNDYKNIIPFNPNGLMKAMQDRPDLVKKIKVLGQQWDKNYQRVQFSGGTAAIGGIAAIYGYYFKTNKKDGVVSPSNTKIGNTLFVPGLIVAGGAGIASIPFSMKINGVEKKIMAVVKEYNEAP